MRPSPKHLLGRAAEKARQSAAGSPTPAGQPPPPPPPPPAPEETGPPEQSAPRETTKGRVAIRRRIRRLRRTREVLMRDLGALLVEMHRQGRQNPELLKRKSAEVAALETELHGLRAALDEGLAVERVVAAGVAGRCASCATLMGIDDRYCPNCGTPARPPKAAAGSEEKPAGEPELSAAAGTKKE